MRKCGHIWPLLLASLLATSCFKDLVKDVSDSVMVQSSYSLPVGKVEYSIRGNDFLHFPGTQYQAQYNDTLLQTGSPIIEYTADKEFDFSRYSENLSTVKFLTFSLVVENNTPAGLQFQVFFIDGQSFSIGQLISGNGLKVLGANTDSDNKLPAPFIAVYKVPLPATILNRLDDVRKIRFFCWLDIHNEGELLYFYQGQWVKVEIGLEVELEYNLKDFISL